MSTAAPTTEAKKDAVPSTYRDKYKGTGGTCGDFIATKLQKIAKDGIDGLETVKRDNGIEATRWAGFNPGMQRMNLANVLRGRFLNGDTITILGKQYNAKHIVEEDFNGTLADDEKTLLRVADLLDLQQNDRTVAALRKLFFAPAKPKVDREAKRAEREAEAKAKKDRKAAEKKLAAAKKAEVKANEKLEKLTTGLDELKATARTLAAEAAAAAEDKKEAAEKLMLKANEKVGTAEDKVDEAAKAADAATAARVAAEAELAALAE